MHLHLVTAAAACTYFMKVMGPTRFRIANIQVHFCVAHTDGHTHSFCIAEHIQGRHSQSTTAHLPFGCIFGHGAPVLVVQIGESASRLRL